MHTCTCIFEMYIRKDTTISIARLIVVHPREWLVSLADKQFGHCEIWSHFGRVLYFYSPSASDYIDATHEICNS